MAMRRSSPTEDTSAEPAAVSIRRAGDWLHEGRQHDRAGRIEDAVQCYQEAIGGATPHDSAVRAESMRRLGVIFHLRADTARAQRMCQASRDLAIEIGDNLLAAEAINTLAGLEFEAGEIAAARAGFNRAIALASAYPALVARAEQNLGVLATIQGDLDDALQHYQRSLDASRAANDELGCAITYHNLGMVSSDRRMWDDADGYFKRSLAIAQRLDDVHLQGLCLLNHSEVHIARQRYDEARTSAEAALSIFDRLGARLDKADTYTVLGVVFRETGRTALAESRFRAAIDLALQSGSILSEAEASRELARLYQDMGRNQDALRLLNVSHRLFARLD
ncbi:MAG: tetratricopeptide repeat protein, partial [Gemmatimonadales bacterium]|nr:tetratricopeptide repeat protein [Gemmatimonadales bacterium]